MPNDPDVRVLQWRYQHNPLGEDDEYVDEKDAKVSDYMPVMEDDDEISHEVGDIKYMAKPKPFIVTPGGLMPIDCYTTTAKAMEIWIGDTNFRITPRIERTICEYPGVSGYKIIDPYTFRVSFARAFRDSDKGTTHVRDGLAKALGVDRGIDALPADIRKAVIDIKKEAEAGNLFWVANVMPNDNVVYAVADNKDQFNEYLAVYKLAVAAVGGSTHYSSNC